MNLVYALFIGLGALAHANNSDINLQAPNSYGSIVYQQFDNYRGYPILAVHGPAAKEGGVWKVNDAIDIANRTCALFGWERSADYQLKPSVARLDDLVASLEPEGFRIVDDSKFVEPYNMNFVLFESITCFRYPPR